MSCCSPPNAAASLAAAPLKPPVSNYLTGVAIAIALLASAALFVYGKLYAATLSAGAKLLISLTTKTVLVICIWQPELLIEIPRTLWNVSVRALQYCKNRITPPSETKPDLGGGPSRPEGGGGDGAPVVTPLVHGHGGPGDWHSQSSAGDNDAGAGAAPPPGHLPGKRPPGGKHNLSSSEDESGEDS